MKLGGVVAASLIASGVIEYTKPTHVEQTEIVQPYDTDWTLAVRAEKDAGIDRNAVDIRPAVARVAEQYGTVLQPGEKVKVELDK
jgi:hypothetical protein